MLIMYTCVLLMDNVLGQYDLQVCDMVLSTQQTVGRPVDRSSLVHRMWHGIVLFHILESVSFYFLPTPYANYTFALHFSGTHKYFECAWFHFVVVENLQLSSPSSFLNHLRHHRHFL